MVVVEAVEALALIQVNQVEAEVEEDMEAHLDMVIIQELLHLLQLQFLYQVHIH